MVKKRCMYCGRWWKNKQARRAHNRWCDWWQNKIVKPGKEVKEEYEFVYDYEDSFNYGDGSNYGNKDKK